MSEPAVLHIAKGAEEVSARSTDEVAARLRAFDLRQHRTQERTLASGAVAACILTALVFLAAVYSSVRRRADAADASLLADTDSAA